MANTVSLHVTQKVKIKLDELKHIKQQKEGRRNITLDDVIRDLLQNSNSAPTSEVHRG